MDIKDIVKELRDKVCLCHIDKESVLLIANTLEKQIPKKPEHLIAKEDTRIGAGVWRKGTKITKCICGSLISRGNYCHHCGQKIDWED